MFTNLFFVRTLAEESLFLYEGDIVTVLGSLQRNLTTGVYELGGPLKMFMGGCDALKA